VLSLCQAAIGKQPPYSVGSVDTTQESRFDGTLKELRFVMLNAAHHLDKFIVFNGTWIFIFNPRELDTGLCFDLGKCSSDRDNPFVHKLY
jgi:hypothetical protein